MELPRAAAEVIGEDPLEPFVLTVDAGGNYYLQDEPDEPASEERVRAQAAAVLRRAGGHAVSGARRRRGLVCRCGARDGAAADRRRRLHRTGDRTVSRLLRAGLFARAVLFTAAVHSALFIVLIQGFSWFTPPKRGGEPISASVVFARDIGDWRAEDLREREGAARAAQRVGEALARQKEERRAAEKLAEQKRAEEKEKRSGKNNSPSGAKPNRPNAPNRPRAKRKTNARWMRCGGARPKTRSAR